jgi:outer membrane receptor protein involved in Fe transport
MQNTIRRARLMCSAAAMALVMPALAHAEAANFNIAPQSLSSALKEFSLQSQFSLVAPPDVVDAKITRGVSQSAEPEVALAALLEGTGLSYRRDGDTFLIVRASDPQSGSAAGDGAEGTVQALIVTAQKREEDIQDVPIAISAFTQEDLTRSQVAGGPDLVTQVPNFTFTKTNFSSYSIQIRGIGTQAISATTDPGVAVAFNNTPFTRNRFFEQEFYDLERVEVLRGPQGTLYGRNATAGVVNIISAKPKFNFEAKASADLGNYSSSRVEGMVNIPLVEDAVALRIAGAWTKRNGYAENELTGGPIDGRDLWSTRVSLRVRPSDRFDMNLIWEHFQEDDDRLRSGKQLCKKDVVTQVGNALITDYYDTRTSGGQTGRMWAGVQPALSQGCKPKSLYDENSFQRPNGMMLPYYVPLSSGALPVALTDPYVGVVNSTDPLVIDAANDQPANLRVIQSTVDPEYRAKSDLGELQISFDITDNLTFSSETAYSVDQVWSLQDFNRFNTAAGAWLQPDNVLSPKRPGVMQAGPNGGVFCDPQLGCSDRLVAVDIATAKASQFSQEFRLGSNFDGPFNFSLGANFMRADSLDKYYIFFNSLSLVAAKGPGGVAANVMTPYVPGQTDNAECLTNGYLPGDPDLAYSVFGCVYMDPNPIGRLNDKGHNYFLSNNPYKLISYAAFGEVYYNIADNLKLTAGLRWTVDEKEAPIIPSWILTAQSVGYPVADVIEREWREPTGRLTIDWKPDLSFTDETMAHASFAHGYKAGGINPPGYIRGYYADINVALQDAAESATRPKTFEPEFVDAYEIGAKNTLDDGRVTLNLAAFYYNYKDYQISEIVDRSAFNRNFDAEIWGAELEAEWRPLENLRLGFKGGYEKTRIGDNEQAIDLMDRTAGDPDWVVARPFPTFPSSCILPTYVFANPDGTIGRVGTVGGGGPSGCELAYSFGLDPITQQPYVDLTTNPPPAGSNLGNLNTHPGYPGFDPSTAPNGGEGIMKPLGGNELPNAPHYTATVTGDYTLPLANEWLMTLHTDVHWQSQSWWRVFNDNAYDKLHPYFTMNLAAIFTNEERGWNIMAYIKNVTDETAITGAFLNSDDTGLTTNVFLTEPRLYGLRVTKNWSGGPLLGNFGARHEGPYPFTVELGGQVQRHDAPNQAMMPSFADAFSSRLGIFDKAQDSDLDWGDGREVKLTWRPDAGAVSISLDMRSGQANAKFEPNAEWSTDPVCIWGSFLLSYCTMVNPPPAQERGANFSARNHAEATVVEGESYKLGDMEVRKDFGFAGLSASSIGLGLRYVSLESSTYGDLSGIPDWVIPANSFVLGSIPNQGPATYTRYDVHVAATRGFEGAGPVLSWKAAYTVLDLPNAGRLDLDWSIGGGVAYGTRKASVAASQTARAYEIRDATVLTAFTNTRAPTLLTTTTPPPVEVERSGKVVAPALDLSLGLAYTTDRFNVGAGYRWERYFNAIDGGFMERKEYDRTIDGPYFKVSVGFGG